MAKISIEKLYFVTGKNDKFSTPKDVKRLKKELKK